MSLTFALFEKLGVEKINKISKCIAIALAFLMLCSIASAATLNVGPREKYRTIQSAVNVAQDGDTINVASGTYAETVEITKNLNIYGKNYPKVDGFNFDPNYEAGTSGTGILNGFSIQKSGVQAFYDYEAGTIRNNYFSNCGISLNGQVSKNAVVMNNQISGGTISISSPSNTLVKGNTVSNAKCGLYIEDITKLTTVTSNTFKNCGYGVYIYTTLDDLGKLTTFSGNKYIGDTHSIGWGTSVPTI